MNWFKKEIYSRLEQSQVFRKRMKQTRKKCTHMSCRRTTFLKNTWIKTNCRTTFSAF